MKNEEIVAKLREALINISSRMVEPLVATTKCEHVFILDKDISDCNESIAIEVTIQSNKNIPQAVIRTETKTTRPPKGYSKEITIDTTPMIISLIDDASFSEVAKYISDLAYNLSDVINEYGNIEALAELESNILMVSRGLFDYTIILPETNTCIIYNVLEFSDNDNLYEVYTRFNGQVVYAKSAHSIVGAASIIKDICPKDISECWWRLDLISLMTKLFNVKEPKILDNKTYIEYIGEFSLPTNRKIDCNCWLKVTKSNINEQSKLYIESNTLTPYISIKVALDGFDNIVGYAYNAMNKIAGIIRILDTMKIDDGMTLYQLLARTCKPSAHIEITCHNSNMVLVSYYENGKYNNIWVSFPSHNRPNITIGNNYETSESCDSLEEAVIKVITEARENK
jgi:hypothetical protein